MICEKKKREGNNRKQQHQQNNLPKVWNTPDDDNKNYGFRNICKN